LALVLQFVAPPPVYAQEDDSRLTVELIEDSTLQGAPDADLLLKQALPILWDRIVPVAQRRLADTLASNSSMVARIVPGREATVVEFQGARVFAALREANIAAIVTPPRFHLLLSVRNTAGREMQQTTQLLEEESSRLAPAYGIELSGDGAGLVLEWRWLDTQRIELSVRGQSRLAEFVEMREISDADSLPAMQAWLDEVLLKARDAYAYDALALSNTQIGAEGSESEFVIELVVQRTGSLLEQVALEESLAHDPRVRGLLPLRLSQDSQRYRVQLEGGDTSWLGEWFARRGYRMNRLADGSWLIQ
jgi:hypothetical protein